METGRFHGKCIGLKNKAAIAALPDPWACQKCSKEGEAGKQTSTGKRVACPDVAPKTKKDKKKGELLPQRRKKMKNKNKQVQCLHLQMLQCHTQQRR
jgi:hypothetical protein